MLVPDCVCSDAWLVFIFSVFVVSDAELDSHSTQLLRKVGENVRFECSFGGLASQASDFTWSGPALVDLLEDRVRIVNSHGYFSSLEIDAVDLMDAGQYMCSHARASSSIVFNLTVLGKLSFD